MTCNYSKQDLEFVAAPALQPAETVVDPELMAKYAAEMEAVSLHLNRFIMIIY